MNGEVIHEEVVKEEWGYLMTITDKTFVGELEETVASYYDVSKEGLLSREWSWRAKIDKDLEVEGEGLTVLHEGRKLFHKVRQRDVGGKNSQLHPKDLFLLEVGV